MSTFSAKDVQALRQATGAGMMDAKKALTENGGDYEAAAKWLREKGLGKAAERSDRDNSQGAVVAVQQGNVAAMVELKCETDFVAKSDGFLKVLDQLAEAVLADGQGAAAARAELVDDLKVVLKENIELGEVVRIEAPEGHVIDTYVHRQDGRGVNAVIVELDGGSIEVAHDVAVHIAFTKPKYLVREEVPADVVAAEREVAENQARNEGKPEAAWPKIVEGKLTGFFRESVLTEQKFVRDEKQSIQQLLGDNKIVRFAQVVIGA